MFNRFKQLFAQENLLDSAFSTTLKMLEFDLKMYDASYHTLRHSDTDELPFDVRGMDRKINKYERKVRRQVLTHLTISGNQNLVPGLALVSIVIDVERIGDYTKNIVDVSRKHPARLSGGSFEDDLAEIEKTIDRIFPKVIECLRSQDSDLGRDVMETEEPTGKKAEAIIAGLMTESDPSLGCADSVCLGMYARFLKRINAHLVNIASSQVNPFPRISFREKRVRE